MINWQAIIDKINAETGRGIRPQTPRPVSGGCINQAYRLEAFKGSVFIKLNDRNAYPMFAAESRGLKAMHSTAAIRVVSSANAARDSPLHASRRAMTKSGVISGPGAFMQSV